MHISGVNPHIEETKWMGSKARSIGGGFKLFYHGVDGRRNGVGAGISPCPFPSAECSYGVGLTAQMLVYLITRTATPPRGIPSPLVGYGHEPSKRLAPGQR